MNEFFNALPWHDSVLLELNASRSVRGSIEEVQLKVRWPDGGEGTVRFCDCVHVDDLTPAYADERVLEANVVDEDWVQNGIPEGLSHRPAGDLPLRSYRFRTSARNEAIQIYAFGMEILT